MVGLFKSSHICFRFEVPLRTVAKPQWLDIWARIMHPPGVWQGIWGARKTTNAARTNDLQFNDYSRLRKRSISLSRMGRPKNE